MTSTLFIKLKIKPILAGILTATMLYSINLRVNGKANVPLFNFDSVFDSSSTLVILIALVIAIKIMIDLFLKTETGYLLLATGDNETLVRSLGVNSNKYKIMGFMLANGLISLSGALMAQYQGFADITMGTGVMVVGLASVIIGDTLMKRASWFKSTSRAIVGATIYKIMGGIAIDLGLAPTDLKAISAIIVISFIAYNNLASDLFGKATIKERREINVKDTKPIKEF
jgi:putative ABC transport system permease protein